jgi:integrase
MTEVKNHPRLFCRGKTYYYRRRVPADLLAHFGRKEIIFSLQTSDKKQASEKARVEDVKCDQQFVQLRAARAPVAAAELTPVEIERLALIYKADILGADEEARKEAALGGPLSWMYDHMDPGPVVDELEELEVALSAPRSLLRNTSTEDRFLASQGLVVGRDNLSLVPLMEALKAARQAALQGLVSRYNGQQIPTPAVPSAPSRAAPASSRLSLDDLLSYWKQQRTRPARSVMDAATAVQRLQARTPGLSASEITKGHVVAYKDAELAKGLSVATVNKSLGLLKAIFKVAVDNDKLPASPAESVKTPATRQGPKSRVPFAGDDLRQIFTSTVFATDARPSGGKGEAAFWLPLIALFTGARQSEIGQLQTVDICERGPGLFCFHFTDESSPDQRLKTSTSRRWVPIHPELIKCGLLDYWRERKASGDGPLFPLLTRRYDNIAASWSQWFGRYLRKEVGIADKRKVFHSFRHGFKDALRAAGVEKAINDALTGHESGDVGSTYGDETYPLPPLVEAIERLNYPGLDLSHLYRK